MPYLCSLPLPGRLLEIVSGAIYLFLSLNNAASLRWGSFEGRNRRAPLITSEFLLSPTLSPGRLFPISPACFPSTLPSPPLPSDLPSLSRPYPFRDYPRFSVLTFHSDFPQLQAAKCQTFSGSEIPPLRETTLRLPFPSRPRLRLGLVTSHESPDSEKVRDRAAQRRRNREPRDRLESPRSLCHALERLEEVARRDGSSSLMYLYANAVRASRGSILSLLLLGNRAGNKAYPCEASRSEPARTRCNYRNGFIYSYSLSSDDSRRAIRWRLMPRSGEKLFSASFQPIELLFPTTSAQQLQTHRGVSFSSMSCQICVDFR